MATDAERPKHRPSNPPLFNVIHAKSGDCETEVTLRDLFAAAIRCGMEANPHKRMDLSASDAAEYVGEEADALLAEREKAGD